MELLPFTRLLNALFARPVDGLLALFGVHPLNPATPFGNTISMEILVALLLALLATLLGARLSVETPSAGQHAVEMAWTALSDHSVDVIGHDGPRFLNYLFTLVFFILVANLIGLIPGFASPTASIKVTVGLALCSFFYYHAVGIRKLGVGHYLKQFLGPIPALAILMVPVEIISHLARILSLSVRLYANMFAGELITTIFLALIPVSGVIFLGLHFFVGILQAYIFLVLTMVYLAGAVAEEH